MSPPQVSVVLATYNNASTIGEAIASILLQGGCEFELLVVNDASTDGTLEVAEHFARRDPRVHIVSLPNNSGRAVARNKAIMEARGEWLAIMDGDDISLPNRLQAQLAYLKANPDLDWVSTWGYILTGRTNGIFKVATDTQHHAIVENIANGRMPIIHASAMFRRAVMIELSGYPTEFQSFGIEDYDLLRRWAMNHSIGVLNQFLYAYRMPSAESSIARYRAVLRMLLAKSNVPTVIVPKSKPRFYMQLFLAMTRGYVPGVNRIYQRLLNSYLRFNSVELPREIFAWFRQLEIAP